MNLDTSQNHNNDLKNLELRIDELIQLCQQFKSENQSLREQQSQLSAERSHLIEKNELAKSRIEAMIMRLKTLEQAHDE